MRHVDQTQSGLQSSLPLGQSAYMLWMQAPSTVPCSPTSLEPLPLIWQSLYSQKPSSEMAQDFVVAYGVLSWDEAQKLYLKVCKRKGAKPAASAAAKAEKGKPEAKPKASKKKPAARGRGKKAKVLEDDDLLPDGVDIGEGVGTTGL
ncbi:unnamed protein product [Chrysoparadoxa australica]